MHTQTQWEPCGCEFAEGKPVFVCRDCQQRESLNALHLVASHDEETPALTVSSEVRVTDPTTGGQKGQKLEAYDLIPPEALAEVARVYGYGASKYAARNWERGYAWGLSFAALMRHAWLFWWRKNRDPESGLHHLAHAVFHCFSLMTWERTHPELDDRP